MVDHMRPFPLHRIVSLDDRWLEYVARTRDVFAAHPYAVPLRQPIFKQYVEQKISQSLQDNLKHWAKFALQRKQSTGDLSPVDVLFWLDSPREVQTEAILPVLNRVQAAGKRAALIIPKGARQKFGQLPERIIEFSAPYRWHAVNRWKAAWDALQSALPDDLAPASYSHFLTNAYAAENTRREVERLLSHLKPKLVVCAIDQLLPSSAMCIGAQSAGVPSLVLLHGAVSPYNAPITADKMGVWGNVSHDHMIGLGVQEERLAVLGSPRHDRFPGVPVDEARRRLTELLGLTDKPIFVFFSNGNDPLRNSVEALEGCAGWLDVASRALADRVQFVVRLHPNENGDLYKPYPQLHVIKNECDLDVTLGAADICGALCSTTLSDALIYRKPVLQFYADGWRDLADNWRRGSAERITSPQHLLDVLAGGDACWREIAAQQANHLNTVMANHGHAADIVTQYIIRHYVK